MQPIQTLIAAAGWTSFSAVFSTVFPLVVFIAVLTAYVVASRKHP
jgi:ABC-type transport system involved in multi-copper enzyme maturation permease subunit